MRIIKRLLFDHLMIKNVVDYVFVLGEPRNYLY